MVNLSRAIDDQEGWSAVVLMVVVGMVCMGAIQKCILRLLTLCVFAVFLISFRALNLTYKSH